jgi:hypothetical protein
MGVFMSQRFLTRVPQAQKDFIERVRRKSGPSRTRPYRTTPGPFPINVVSKRVSDKRLIDFNVRNFSGIWE